MQIITTHMNADFDGLASMVAAKKLYPEGVLVFPGAQEKNVRDYLSQELLTSFEIKRLKQIDTKTVQRLIVVDTRQADRLDRLQDCLDNPGIEVHLYDHHPDAPGDMHGNRETVEPTGSTTAIFCRIFREKGITITPDEATLLALGIYEDTGCFLHGTTTPEDQKAAAWLLENGANLDIITEFVSRDLSVEQIGLLGELINNAATYTIQSIEIVVAKLTTREYVDNAAVLIRRLMVMENLDVLFGLLNMGERIYLIARSRIPEVNVGVIARDFGGGGHASAASATIRDMSIFEAEEKLIHLLHRHVKPKAIAAEIMSSPVITLSPEISIQEANDLLTRYSITALPVILRQEKDNRDIIQGFITRRVVEKAIYHKLGHLPVADYMTTDIATVSDKATLADLQELIIENRQRLIPVMKEERIAGVVTRTDLLNLLVNDPAHLPHSLLHETEHPSVARSRNLSNLVGKQLKKKIVALLQEIGTTANKLGCNAYVVGGFVRDLLLGIDNYDIDIVIEGDGIQFAETFAKIKKGSVRPHEKFGTATVILPGDRRLDVATARLEYYEYPAAMPTVELSSIKLDLYRRDFTINAMAIHLNPERFGTLVDFFNSQNDLKERRIRVLHNLSFVEDPTRIFRAVRFEQRLHFTITRHCEKLIKNAVRMNLFDRFSGQRFFQELKLILSEDNPMPALQRLSELGLFPFLWPDLRPNMKIDRRFRHVLTQASRAVAWYKLLYRDKRCRPWMVYLLAIMSRSRIRELLAFCTRFELSEKQTKMLVKQKEAAERISKDMLRRPRLRPSEIYWLLQDLDINGLLYLMTIARKTSIQKAASHFVTSLAATKPLLNGNDFMAMGYAPGPQYRTMLNYLLEVQMDGKIHTPKEAKKELLQRFPIKTARNSNS